MGCDIWAFVETFDSEKKRWRLYRELKINRDYSLFGILAGVREEEMQIFELKNDISDFSIGVVDILETNIGSDAHHISYVTLEEIEKSNYLEKIMKIVTDYKKYKKEPIIIMKSLTYGFQDIILYLSDTKETNKLNSKDVRLCFWFDN